MDFSLDAQNHSGETPLHWAMRAGRIGMEVVGVLLENGARPSCLNKNFRRAVDCAADGFEDDPASTAPKRQLEKPLEKRKRVSKEEKRLLLEVTEERKEVRENLLKRSAQSRTLVLHHPECLEHTPKSSTDWEAPDRITAIMGRVAPPEEDISGRSVLMPYEVTLSSEFERAKLDLLSRVHSTDYLAFVNDLSKELERRQKQEVEAAGEDSSDDPRSGQLTPPVVPFTPMVGNSKLFD
jgi:Ankyrin repeat